MSSVYDDAKLAFLLLHNCNNNNKILSVPTVAVTGVKKTVLCYSNKFESNFQ